MAQSAVDCLGRHSEIERLPWFQVLGEAPKHSGDITRHGAEQNRGIGWLRLEPWHAFPLQNPYDQSLPKRSVIAQRELQAVGNGRIYVAASAGQPLRSR